MTPPSQRPATQEKQTTGRLIVIEGPDGVGKSTVSAAVAEALRTSRPCEHLSFPGREPGTLGDLVYRLHHDHGALGVRGINAAALQTLHIAAHVDAIARRIAPALDSGSDVVLDRFWWSTLAYGAVAGLDRALLMALINVERHAWGIHRPTLAVLLRRDAPVNRAYEHRERWLRLRAEYDVIISDESTTTPTLVVNNAADALAARDRILEALRGESRRESGGRGTPSSSSKRDSPSRSTPKTPRQDAASKQPANLPARQPDLFPPSVALEVRPNDHTTTEFPTLFVPHLAPAKVTAVYDTYWRFAAERQSIFFRRLEGAPAPWTDDQILSAYKFTNAYRAADRVSQYLIRHVIYRSDLPDNAEEVCFRILLFKLFNRIETWELLEGLLGPLTWEDFQVESYDRVLTNAMSAGKRIYSAAYIMPPGGHAFGHRVKHRNHLALVARMMHDNVPHRLANARSMQQAFELLRSYPTIGDFLAYQFVTDINYSEVTQFSEMEFVVPGPGAQSGLTKCFVDRGGLNEPELIRVMADLQHEEFDRLGVRFRSLWGRPLQLIDCQNLFCEVDKYSRVRHPEVAGRSGRTQIKQRYVSAAPAIDYWFPPKWKLNDRIGRENERSPQ